jgi:hypothetical protein
MHAVRCALLREQAAAAGLPLYEVRPFFQGGRACAPRAFCSLLTGCARTAENVWLARTR